MCALESVAVTVRVCMCVCVSECECVWLQPHTCTPRLQREGGVDLGGVVVTGLSQSQSVSHGEYVLLVVSAFVCACVRAMAALLAAAAHLASVDGGGAEIGGEGVVGLSQTQPPMPAGTPTRYSSSCVCVCVCARVTVCV